MKSFLATMIIFAIAIGWETDNFTTRVELLKQDENIVRENLYRLNNQTNKMLEGAIEHFNRNGDCQIDMSSSKPLIYEMVKNNLGGGFVSGALEIWAADEEKSGIEIPSLEGKDIYSAMLWSPDPAMNLAGHVVGTDKLGHFVDQGFDLFSKLRFPKSGFKAIFSGSTESFEEVLEYSESLEEEWGPYGLTASGVKSYGDLAANYAGMRFFINLLDGSQSHIKCDEKSGKYELANPMNWADYVDDSMDEGVNCSLFQSHEGPVTRAGERKYRKRLNEMNNKGKELNKNLRQLYEDVYSLEGNKDLKFNNFCPVESAKCDKLLSRNCANYLISPKCFIESNADKSYSCNEIGSGFPVTEHKYSAYTYPAPVDGSGGKGHGSTARGI